MWGWAPFGRARRARRNGWHSDAHRHLGSCRPLHPGPNQHSPRPTLRQVTHPGDASNFKVQLDDSAAGGAYRSQPYKTTGDFANF